MSVYWLNSWMDDILMDGWIWKEWIGMENEEWSDGWFDE